MTTRRDAAYYRNLSIENDPSYDEETMEELFDEIEGASLNGKYKIKISKNVWYYGGNEPAKECMDEYICGNNSIYEKMMNNKDHIISHLQGLGFTVEITNTYCVISW